MTHPVALPLPPAGTPEEYRVPPEKRVDGDPRQWLWTQYTDASGQFFAGVWRSEPGTWRVAYTEEEFCQMLEGRSVITGDDGRRLEVGPGDSFVVPRGFTGTWQVLETTTKRFVIHEPRAAAG